MNIKGGGIRKLPEYDGTALRWLQRHADDRDAIFALIGEQKVLDAISRMPEKYRRFITLLWGIDTEQRSSIDACRGAGLTSPPVGGEIDKAIGKMLLAAVGRRNYFPEAG